jgi:hypothetical protein
MSMNPVVLVVPSWFVLGARGVLGGSTAKEDKTLPFSGTIGPHPCASAGSRNLPGERIP